jgi:DNA-binding MarR family transcriptional regulator
MTNITRDAFSAMRRILRRVEQQSRELMAHTGLTPAQLVLLQELEGGREQRVSDVAAALGISSATTTVMTQKLESRGLLRRRTGHSDRRQIWLSLTDTGETLLHVAPDNMQARFAEAFEALAPWERMMIVANLMRVAELLDAEADAAPLLDSEPVLTEVTQHLDLSKP